MKDVGANRLICVSAQPFPVSIKDKVIKELGLAVLLVRLNDLETNQWPIQIVNNSMLLIRSKIDVDTSVQPFFLFPPGQNPFNQAGVHLNGKDCVIRRDGRDDLLPLADFLDEAMEGVKQDANLLGMPEGVHRADQKWKPTSVSLCLGSLSAPIQTVTISYRIEVRHFNLAFQVSSYAQEGHDKALAWIMRACGRIDDEDVEVRFTLVPKSNGGFTMSEFDILGIKGTGYIRWGFRNQQT